LGIDKIGIVGMGSLGMLFGSLLVDALGQDAVIFIMDQERKNKYNGIIRKVNGKPYPFQIVSCQDPKILVDVLIFAVKGTGLNDAMALAKNWVGEKTTLISLLNGITSEQVIGEQFGHNKVLYAVAEGMDPVIIGEDMTYTNSGYLRIGTDTLENGKKERLDQLLALFESIGFPYKKEEDVRHRLWSKFMLNVGVNQVVMVYEGTYGTIQKTGEARDLMIEAMKEVIPLAQKEGVAINEQDLWFYVELVDTLNPQGMPSMRQDSLYGKKTEVEMFSGKVLELGEKHGMATPINSKIYEKINKMERLIQ